MVKKIFSLLKSTMGYRLKLVVTLLVFSVGFFVEDLFLASGRDALFREKASDIALYFFTLAIIGILMACLIRSIVDYYEKQFGDLIFWLAWSEFSSSVFYCFVTLPQLLILCTAFRIIHIVLFGRGAGAAGVVFFVASLLWGCFLLFATRHHHFAKKRRRQRSVSASVNPWINAVKTMVYNRAKCTNYILLHLSLLLFLFFVSGILPHDYGFFLFFATIVLLLGIEDFYWKNEENNFFMYRINLVSLKKYLIVQYASSFMYNIWAIVLFFFKFSDTQKIVPLFLLLCFVMFYWQQVYIYLGLARYNSLGIRNLFCVLFMVLMLIPIGNIIVSLFLLFKNSKGWNENDLDCQCN